MIESLCLFVFGAVCCTFDIFSASLFSLPPCVFKGILVFIFPITTDDDEYSSDSSCHDAKTRSCHDSSDEDDYVPDFDEGMGLSSDDGISRLAFNCILLSL